jgi:S-DNA-T family DNA segregation ATPase FtsK/SpoIIIE
MPEASVDNEVPQHRRQILSFVGILLSFMLLLSLLSYSSSDQASGELSLFDLWKVFSNDPDILAKAAHTENWLGLIGAIVSNWFINNTIGYAVLVVPVLGFIWSGFVLSRKNFQKLFTATNYTIVLSLLFSALCGTIKHFDDGMPIEWSGVVGHFIASILSKLIGLAGTVLFLCSALVITITLLVDLDYTLTIVRVRNLYLRAVRWLDEKQEERQLRATEKAIQLNRQAQLEVEIKKPEQELQLTKQAASPMVMQPTARIKPLPNPQMVSPAVRAVVEKPLPDESLKLEIQEGVIEEEVNFDDREQPSEENVEAEIDYVFPSVELLDAARASEEVDETELKGNAELLRTKLADFGVEIESVSVTPGPVVTLYELVPATGVKISRIESLQDDIALALKAKGIRIIAPIPGKGTVGVEIPNHYPSLVTIRSIINSAKFRDSTAILPLAMGKTISGEVFVDDLTKMPHLLIAGATGSGKSVGVNTIIAGLLYRKHPSELKFAIIDPKKIELALYTRLRKHYLLVSPDIDEEIVTAPNNAVLLLKSLEIEMDKRYDRLAAAGVRNILDYNEKVKSGKLHDTEQMKHRKLPYIVVIVDELADLMITAAREVEEPIARLAQLARAVGIHLVLATQRPSVDVITGVIKANFPARIAFQVASRVDSRTILDGNGAEQLLGNGDMLYVPPGSSKAIRIQNAFISTEEVERLTHHVGKQQGYSNPAKLPSALEKRKTSSGLQNSERDELFEEAARIIVRHQQGSVSLLQRRLKVGYSRAARLVDELEEAGIVGSFDGSKAREVLVESEATLEVLLKSLE